MLLVGGAVAQPELLRGGLDLLQAAAELRQELVQPLDLEALVAPESRFIVASSSSRLCTNGLTLSSEPVGAFCPRIVFVAASMSVMARTVRRSRSTRLTGQPRLAIDMLAFSQAASAVRVHLSSAARFCCAVGPSGPPPHPATTAANRTTVPSAFIRPPSHAVAAHRIPAERSSQTPENC